MKLDSIWKQSILETSDIFVALIFGIAFEKAIASNVGLILDIEVPSVIIVLGIAGLLKQYRITAYTIYRKFVLRLARWLVGIWAAVLFTIGYSLITAYWQLGAALTALFFALVVSLIRYHKIVEQEPRNEQSETIARASVRDPIFDTPEHVEPATRGEISGIAIGVALIIIFFSVYTWSVNAYIKNLTIDQVNQSSPLVVQLDSFLTGGWVFGFFYYWGQWEKALRASKKARASLRGKPKDAIQFKTADHAKMYYRMLSKEKSITPTSTLFVVLVLGVVMFILSAIAAVYAVLTYTIIAVQLELEFLVGGVLVMVMSWVVLRYVTYQLRAQADAALEFGD